jgi:diguanylate cyclase (GGDEF)-like protein
LKNFSASTKPIEHPRPYLKGPGQKRTLLGWWYRIASPPEPQSLASFEQREQFRRGRTGSQVVLAIFAVYISGLPDAFTGTNRFLAVILIVAMLAMAVAILLNRRGHVTLAGIIVVIAVTASPLTDLVTTPGGLNSSRIPVFCMLVLPLMCTVSFLPAWWVFVAAVGNCLFAVFVLTLVPHAAELNAILKVSFVGFLTPIILSQIIVSAVAYLWVTGAVQAIRRADRAEEIAELERDLALRAENSAQQKEHLNQVIEEKNVALQQANTHLEALAITDPLTELPNHRALLETLEKEVERARRYGHSLSILFFDGDHFKQVNDTHGHRVGDAVLRELGRRGKGVLRGGDMLGRYGGEEFMLLLPETDLVLGSAVAERLRVAIATHPLATDLVEGGLHVTISIGVATFPLDGRTGNEVLEKADQAMYWAKRLGRNQIRTVVEAERAAQDSTLLTSLSNLERHDGKSRENFEQTSHDQRLGTIRSLMLLLEQRDQGISAHSYQVSQFARNYDVAAGRALMPPL